MSELSGSECRTSDGATCVHYLSQKEPARHDFPTGHGKDAPARLDPITTSFLYFDPDLAHLKQLDIRFCSTCSTYGR
jgi:hypothetical protein